MKKLRLGLVIASMVLAFGDICAGVYGAQYCRSHEKNTEITERASSRVRNNETKSSTEVTLTPTPFAELKQSYDAGTLDYAQAKAELNAFDKTTLSDQEASAFLQLENQIETDFKIEMQELAAENEYESIMKELSKQENEAGTDSVLEELREDYEPSYLRTLANEKNRLLAADRAEEAISMLQDARQYVKNDSSTLEGMLSVVEAAAVETETEETETEEPEDEYVIADSDSRYLTETEIRKLSLKEINYAKNEIYARRGRIFSSKELRDYFNSKSWYHGTIEADDFNTKCFNSYENENKDLLSKVEESIQKGGYKLDAD